MTPAIKCQYFGIMRKRSQAEPGVFSDLSRRENQIMEAIYARGEATASAVLESIPNPPTRTAVRTMLTILVDKGLLTHRRDGREYVYQPTRKKSQAGKSVLSRVVNTFFDGSLEKAVAAQLSGSGSKPTEAELREIEKLIREARKEQRNER